MILRLIRIIKCMYLGNSGLSYMTEYLQGKLYQFLYSFTVLTIRKDTSVFDLLISGRLNTKKYLSFPS